MFPKIFIICTLAVEGAHSFPWVSDQAGVDASLLRRQQTPGKGLPGSFEKCPVNPNHQPAAPWSEKFPYNYARDGKKGNETGGFIVPHPDDTAHRFVAPDYSVDIRGPCPGLNALANHNFIAHDGLTNFNELVDAQQNVYNVDHQAAQILAALGLTLTDGDIVTGKLSIGCDATPRTSFNPKLTGSEPGLDGHNKFEADTSLSRNDFFPTGNNFKLNTTLFKMMTKTTGGRYDLKGLSLYRRQRWEQSVAENPDFYFGPLGLLLYGAATFLFELMPSGSRDYKPDVETISYFFGVTEDSEGNYQYTGERIPENWINRVTPFGGFDIFVQIFKMYRLNPVLFGGNTAQGHFDIISDGHGFKNGMLDAIDPASIACLVYQLGTERLPSSFNGVTSPTIDAISLILGKVRPELRNLGCKIPLT